jgi:hypothetical protein
MIGAHYEIYDHYLHEVVECYQSQDRMMQDLYAMYEGGEDLRDYDLLYIGEDESQTLLDYCVSQQVRDWFAFLDKLYFAVRLHAGSDRIGLFEFAEANGHTIHHDACQCPLTTLCLERYYVSLDAELPEHWAGATRMQALATAILAHYNYDQLEKLYE